MWVAKIQEEERQKALSEKLETIQQQVSFLFLTPLTPPPSSPFPPNPPPPHPHEMWVA